MSQMIRKRAKTTPTAMLAAIILAGMPNTSHATTQAAVRPARAALQALALPEASNPNRTRIGRAATNVDKGQLPNGS